MNSSVACDINAPTRVEDLTAEWISSALAVNYPGVKVERCEVVDVIWGMAGKARVSLSYNLAGELAKLPTMMIVKAGYGKYPPDMDWTYSVEVWAYRHVIPNIEVNAPACYFAGVDRHGRSVMLLEDLARRNVTFCRVLNPLNYRQAAAFLDAYARIHAKWWGSPELNEGGKLGFLQKTMDASAAGFWVEYCMRSEVWSEIMSWPRTKAFPQSVLDKERVRNALEQLKKMHDTQPLCVNHGDEHLNNLFLEADGRPGILDWQSRKAPWHMSVAYFLVGAVDIDNRRKWEQPLLSYYLERLAHYNGRAQLDFDQAWHDYRVGMLWGYFIWLSNPDSTQGPANNAANSNRFAMAVLDHHSFDLIEGR